MLKFDDQFPLHRKVAALSDAAFRLHVEAIFWARRNLTDGFVSTEDLTTVSARFSRPVRFAAECVQRGAWHRVDAGVLACAECAERFNGTPLGDGWVVHGFADWQDTRAKVAHKREVRAKAGQAGGIASGHSRRKPKASGKQDASAVLPNERTPSPSPPTGARRAGARDALAPHPFTDDGTGQSCSRCGLLRINKIHTSTKKRS